MLAILANLAGPVFAILVAAPAAPEDTCPNARQVTEALQAHVAAVLVPPSLEPRPDVLRTILDVPADGTVVRFMLVDARGDVQLRRTLPGLGRGRPVADCVALAETIATIVERYLVSVPYQARETEPPPPPTPVAGETVVAAPPPDRPPPASEQGRAVRVYAAGAWRALTTEGPPSLEAQLGGEVDLTRGARRLAALLRGAIDKGQLEPTSAGAAAALHRFSGRLGLSLALPAGPGAIQLALEGGVDLFFAQTNGPGGLRSSWQVSPVGEAGLGYSVTLLRHIFVRPQASLGFAIVRYNAWVPGEDRDVFHTPRLFSTFGLAIGAVFR